MMNKEELRAIGLAAAKNIKTEQDLNEFMQMLTKKNRGPKKPGSERSIR